MRNEQIEAVFENGVFRPLQPIQLPEKQRVTLVIPPGPVGAEEFEEAVEYQPLDLEQRKIIRVRVKHIDDFRPLPYVVEADDMEGG